jgi:putative transposase
MPWSCVALSGLGYFRLRFPKAMPWAGLLRAFGPSFSMPQSLARIVVHVVFSTKHRVPFLKSPELRARLHAYMAGVLQSIGCEPILLNGVEDHVHILCNLSRTITIAGLVEEVKKGSSKWMKEQVASCSDFYWQGGYGAFSVSQSNVDQVQDYVAAQEEHHRKATFQDEFRALCRKHGVELDERYVWD